MCLGRSVTLRGGALGVHRGGVALVSTAVTLYMGEGLRGSNGARLTLLRLSIFHSATHNQTGPLCCWFPSGRACAHSRPLWVSPTTSPVRLGVSPAAAPTPTSIFNQRFEAFFPPCAGALGCAVCFASHRSSWFICVRMWGHRVLPTALPAPFSATLSPALSVYLRECGIAGSASGQTACPVRPTLLQSLSRDGNSSPLCPGCPSPPLLPVWMKVYFLFPWCRTSLPFNFLSVLVVPEGAVCLPTPPSWFSVIGC